jgi:FAD/FMN-containing dehydrogenase
MKVCQELGAEIENPEDDSKQSWLALKDSASAMLSYSAISSRAVPIVDDAVVPTEKCNGFIAAAEELLKSSGQKTFAFWGQAGNGVIHCAPLFDISQIGERQKMFKLLDAYYNLVVESGGSIAGEFAEGRLRGTQSHKVMTPELVDLMRKIKAIFDPYNILNPGVKVDVDIEILKSTLRNNYSFDHQYSHLPRG